MNKQQNGFRSKRRTKENLLKSTQSLKQNSKNFITSVAFLYVEKAFDQVWHVGILDKIKNFGMDQNLLRWINCFLCERSISIKIQYTFCLLFMLAISPRWKYTSNKLVTICWWNSSLGLWKKHHYFST